MNIPKPCDTCEVCYWDVNKEGSKPECLKKFRMGNVACSGYTPTKNLRPKSNDLVFILQGYIGKADEKLTIKVPLSKAFKKLRKQGFKPVALRYNGSDMVDVLVDDPTFKFKKPKIEKRKEGSDGDSN